MSAHTEVSVDNNYFVWCAVLVLVLKVDVLLTSLVLTL